MMQNNIFFLILIISGCLSLSDFKNPWMFENRSTIVHLFEWKFTDISEECKYLGENGFGGVQISPVQESKVEDGNSWYLRYQPVSYKIASRSGSLEEFQQMILSCQKYKIRIYVDVVFNHMASGDGEIIGCDQNKAVPSLLSFPAVPYQPEDFNEFCFILNKSDAFEIRNCRLEGLPDLNQAKESVRSRIVRFLNELIDYGVAGFRVDAVKFMWPNHLMQIYTNLNNLNVKYDFPSNARPFIYQEVSDLGGEVISKTEYIGIAAVTEFMHSNLISSTFKGKKPLAKLLSWGPKKGFAPSSDAIVFVDNQDNQRQHDNILNYKDERNYILANIFMLAHPYGLPRIMSSYHFDFDSQGPPSDKLGNIVGRKVDEDDQCVRPWICEHRWLPIVSMIEFRKIVSNESVTNWADNGQNQIAFCRGKSGFVAFNHELSLNFKANLTVCVPPGTYCDVLSGQKVNGKCTGEKVVVGVDRKAEVSIPFERNVPAVAFHIESQLP